MAKRESCILLYYFQFLLMSINDDLGILSHACVSRSCMRAVLTFFLKLGDCSSGFLINVFCQKHYALVCLCFMTYKNMETSSGKEKYRNICSYKLHTNLFMANNARSIIGKYKVVYKLWRFRTIFTN